MSKISSADKTKSDFIIQYRIFHLYTYRLLENSLWKEFLLVNSFYVFESYFYENNQ